MAVKAVMLPKICHVSMAVENDKAYAAASLVSGNMSPIDSE